MPRLMLKRPGGGLYGAGVALSGIGDFFANLQNYREQKRQARSMEFNMQDFLDANPDLVPSSISVSPEGKKSYSFKPREPGQRKAGTPREEFDLFRGLQSKLGIPEETALQAAEESPYGFGSEVRKFRLEREPKDKDRIPTEYDKLFAHARAAYPDLSEHELDKIVKNLSDNMPDPVRKQIGEIESDQKVLQSFMDNARLQLSLASQKKDKEAEGLWKKKLESFQSQYNQLSDSAGQLYQQIFNQAALSPQDQADLSRLRKKYKPVQ